MIGLVPARHRHDPIEGKELTPATVLEVRRGLGYVTQDGGLFPHLTARDNVDLMARYLGWESRADRRPARRAGRADARFPSDGLDRFPAQLSGGQRQRVSLMRALMLDPARDPARRADGGARPDGPRRAPGRLCAIFRIAGEDGRAWSPTTSPRPAGSATRSS